MPTGADFSDVAILGPLADPPQDVLDQVDACQAANALAQVAAAVAAAQAPAAADPAAEVAAPPPFGG